VGLGEKKGLVTEYERERGDKKKCKHTSQKKMSRARLMGKLKRPTMGQLVVKGID